MRLRGPTHDLRAPRASASGAGLGEGQAFSECAGSREEERRPAPGSGFSRAFVGCSLIQAQEKEKGLLAMASQVQLRHATRRLLRAASHLNRPTNAHAAALLPLATSPQAPAAALPQGAVGSAGLLSSVTAAVRAASGAARLDKGVKRERLTSALEAQRRLLDDLANKLGP